MAATFSCIFLLIAFLALAITTHLLWAWKRIHSHPHVEPARIAIPEVAPYLENMLADISSIANVTPPDLYFRRGHLPNAFLIATIFRSEIFITDALLEAANDKKDKLGFLTHVLCHEVAHIKNNDSIKLGLFTYIKNLAELLKLGAIETIYIQKILLIEQQADITAAELSNQVQSLYAKQ